MLIKPRRSLLNPSFTIFWIVIISILTSAAITDPERTTHLFLFNFFRPSQSANWAIANFHTSNSQSLLIQISRFPTYVLYIDAGVSGKVAQAIAEKLHQLGKQHQVLCVTHQPLIAAMANGHFKVEKTIIEEASKSPATNGNSIADIRTVVRVKALNNHQVRAEELAQITGGHSAEDAIAFAESL
jgi:hypothetical protein